MTPPLRDGLYGGYNPGCEPGDRMRVKSTFHAKAPSAQRTQEKLFGELCALA
jgi:hypothetical protein